MAVAVEIEIHGVSLERYDETNEQIGRLPGGPAASQELFHWVAATEDGFRVVDVWESREAFDRYLRERLEPMFAAAGMATPPEIEILPIHNYSVGARCRE